MFVFLGLNNSISDQLGDAHNARILRLEMENQRLSRQLEEARDGVIQNDSRNSRGTELQKENKRLETLFKWSDMISIHSSSQKIHGLLGILALIDSD